MKPEKVFLVGPIDAVINSTRHLVLLGFLISITRADGISVSSSRGRQTILAIVTQLMVSASKRGFSSRRARASFIWAYVFILAFCHYKT